MILTFVEDRKKLDVMVKPEQRTMDVYQRLLEAGFFSPLRDDRQVKVYSMRKKAYVNPMLTFWQGGIYAGDILTFGAH